MEFVIKNRRFKLEDGVIKCRSIVRGKETKKETWKALSFFRHNKGYQQCVITVEGKKKSFLKHRLMYLSQNPSWDILDGSQDNSIDHINRTKTDNSVDNLRLVTQRQNQYNRDNTKGYYWNKGRKVFQGQIVVNGKKKFLGSFEKEEDARAAYLAAKEIYHTFDNELTNEDLEEIREYNESF
jgi:hypothetical protein